jgi:hypothetical protein
LATKQSIVPFIKFWIASLALAKTAGYPGLCLRKRKQDVDHRESPVKMVVDKPKHAVMPREGGASSTP